MTRERNRKMPDFKPREEWDQEHEANVAKLLGKKKAPDSGATGTGVSMNAMLAYLRVAHRIPICPVVEDTEIKIRRLTVLRYTDPDGPNRFGVLQACIPAGRCLFRCGFDNCQAFIWWNPLAEHDGHCPGCGSLIEAQLQLRKGGRIQMVVVYGNGDIPGL